MVVPTRNALITVALILVLVLGLYFFKTRTANTLDSLSGELYLTLSPLATNQTRLYTYNLSTKVLAQMAPENSFAITASVSPNGQELALSTRPSQSTSTTTLQIHTRDQQTGDIRQITRSSTTLKRLPDWSPDGTKIAFMAQPSGAGKFLVPSDWGVYVTDLSGNEHLISEGGYPKWSSGGDKLLFLRNDGLYLYNTASSTGTALKKLWGGKVALSMKLAINQSRDMVAWTNINANDIAILSVNFQTETAEHFTRFKGLSFWPVFSPDGRYLIVQEVDSVTGLDRPHLTAYDLSNDYKKEILDLSDFDQGKMFLTDWKL